MGHPTVFPTGVTVYKPELCWNGYTIFQANEHGALLIDMNGGEVNFWKGLHGFPNKLLPGGMVMGSRGERDTKFGYQDNLDLVQVDWDGNIVWSFDRHDYVEDPGNAPRWMARQHHDYQREGNPVGYYVPGADPLTDRGNTLILCHNTVDNPKISDKPLHDDTIIEVDWEGNKVWEWHCHEHFNEFDFDEGAKNVIYRMPNVKAIGAGDWFHTNSMSVLGPNKWYDAGDERFHPDNIIIDGRMTNILAIISKETGKIVWKVGPDYTKTKELRRLGQIIGQHHCHMIPQGLPGEGNILVFDNGGWAGYGAPNVNSLNGFHNAKRDYSRIIEFDPTTLRIVWEYTPSDLGWLQPFQSHHFYSPFISSAQRLPNGNTLITEGSGGRIIEVTRQKELVWEYISPYKGKFLPLNMVYRAYRAPYEWVPQLERPEEVAIEPPAPIDFKMPGAKPSVPEKTTIVEGLVPYGENEGFCVSKE